MKTAVQFGAGNIGRGFMGQLFWEAGYKTYFIEYDKELVAMLNKAGRYPLRLLDAYSKKEINLTIDNIEAVSTEETERAAEIFAGADIAGTAVGERALEAIAPIVAAGIRKRMSGPRGPLDIYMCENMYPAGDTLKNYVFEFLSGEEREWAEQNIGFVSTSVARMVPAPDKRFENEGPLFVVADSYHKLPYDLPARRAPEPPIEGLKGVSNFKAEVERKLYTHNLGHAAMGYIGYLKGYTYVHEPFEDDFLRPIFDGALEETAGALVKMYPKDIDPEEHREIREDVNVRFGNPMLMDSLTRVARDPLRKLGKSDRLVGSAKLCLDYGIFPEYIAYICGAAFCYDYPEDPKAVELQEIIRAKGIEAAVNEVSGVDPASPLGKKIIESYNDLRQKRETWK
jgi:mannitol-1-phosphate 5-dehydrogenase